MAQSRSPSTAASWASASGVGRAGQSNPAASAWCAHAVDQPADGVGVAQADRVPHEVVGRPGGEDVVAGPLGLGRGRLEQLLALVGAVGVDAPAPSPSRPGRGHAHPGRTRGPRRARRPCRPSRRSASSCVAQHVRLGHGGHGLGPLLVGGQPVDERDELVGEACPWRRGRRARRPRACRRLSAAASSLTSSASRASCSQRSPCCGGVVEQPGQPGRPGGHASSRSRSSSASLRPSLGELQRLVGRAEAQRLVGAEPGLVDHVVVAAGALGVVGEGGVVAAALGRAARRARPRAGGAARGRAARPRWPRGRGRGGS